MTNSVANRLYMKQRLYSYKFSDDVSISEQLDQFNKFVDDLENIDVSLEDEDKAIILLNALPRSFDQLKDAMLYGREKTITLMEVQSALKTKESLKISQTHLEPGLRFTVLKYLHINVQYLSFDEADLKDDTHLEISGFSVVSHGEGVVSEDFPTSPGFCRVGGALFMVGGMYNKPKLGPTKWLWSAPPPPIPGDGSFTMTWTRCDTAMDSGRINNLVVPLHDGRIFICGGSYEPKCWIEIYDPENGEFDRRDLPEHILNPFPTSCFLLAEQLVMIYYHNGVNKKEIVHPSLVLYDVGSNTWEIFAENLPVPESPLGEMEKRNLIYVGGNILFIIDQASCWFVYDLSAKKEVGKVDVMVKDGNDMQVLYLGNNDMISSSWIFYIFLPNENYYSISTDLRYAKVEVVQRKGGDYIATVLLSGLLRVGDHDELYIFIGDEVSSKRGAEEDLMEVKEEDEK